MKDTKDTILEISFQIFLNEGYKNTTLNSLVKASGLSKGAFYHYFGSKESLYYAVIDKYFLLYFQKTNWDKFSKLSYFQIKENMKQFYLAFVNSIDKVSNIGISSYYVMFFEACKIHPTFLSEVQNFYKQLEVVIDNAIKKDKIDSKAIDLISRFEGILFWIAIFPKSKIETLIHEI